MEIRRAYAENLSEYGANEVWTQLNLEGIGFARCTLEGLMRAEGLSGARRGKTFVVNTLADDRLHRTADLVERKFRAPAPNRLRVADLTYVETHVWVYVASPRLQIDDATVGQRRPRHFVAERRLRLPRRGHGTWARGAGYPDRSKEMP